MEITETLYIKTRKEWRNWLKKNHKICKEIWLVYYKKHTGKPRIPYDEAVEEALCFGWIDSTVKRVDEEYYVQRFTPRKKKSEWSLLNITRIKKLIDLKAVKESGMETIKHIDLDNLEQIKIKEKYQSAEIPEDITNVLQTNKKASTNFIKLQESEKLLYVKWIENAKMDQTRKNRIAEMLSLLEKGLKVGMK